MSAEPLDAEELLHLALSAMEDRRDADALGMLKRGAALAASDGRFPYLMGAVHAQLGMTERAINEFQRAVELAPELDPAHFQLGLLQLSAGDLDSARASWQALDRLGPEHPLALFRDGMLLLAEDRFEACIEKMRLGIERNTEHESLSDDMARVIASVEAMLAEGQQAPTAEDSEGVIAQHVLLAGYRPPVSGSGG